MNRKFTTAAFVAAIALAAPAYGNATYAAKCASCHGADGKGKKALKTLDYTTAEGQKWSDAEGVKVILEGKGKMKGFKDKGIDEAAAKELVKYIRTFKK